MWAGPGYEAADDWAALLACAVILFNGVMMFNKALADVMDTAVSAQFENEVRAVALRVPGGAEMSRGEIDAYTEFVKIYGAKGLAWIKVNDVAKGREGLQSPIVKNLHDKAIAEILARTGAASGDLIFFGADKAKIVNDALGALRVKIGHSDGLETEILEGLQAGEKVVLYR